MHSFSHASGISDESKQGSPMHALGESISFGRFMTESLSWEKWSTFSHNRYVEEAERYAQPGSVAQKKAFFEAHYKRIAAAKKAAAETLLEQAKTNSPDPEPEVETQDCSMIIHDLQSTTNLCSEVDSMKVDDMVAEPEVVTESAMKDESLNHVENVVNQNMVFEMGIGESPQIEKPLLQDLKPSQEATMPSSSKKKHAFSSSKPSVCRRAPTVPASAAKSTLSICLRKENDDITPITRNSPIVSPNKKRPTSKLLRTLIYSTPAKELDISTTLAARKDESSRAAPSSSYKTYDDCKTLIRTPTTGHAKKISKNPSATPCSENRRITTPVDHRVSSVGSKKTGPKRNILSSVFRTEERAARRKQKLEEKFNAKETQKVQLQTRLKEKAETEIRKFRQSLCFKARPLPAFYREKAPITQIKSLKTPQIHHPQSPKLGTKPNSSSTLKGLISLSQETKTHSCTKNSGSQNIPKKKNRIPNHLTSLPEMTTHENTSPNIQLGQPQQK